jgi:hypothetical protein
VSRGAAGSRWTGIGIGHTNGSVTTHYSAAEIDELLEVAEKICANSEPKMATLSLIKRKAGCAFGA